MKYAISASTVFISSVVLLFVFGVHSTNANDPFVSVELGISELSPRGEAGGFAMPASGASVELSYRADGDSTWLTDSVGIFTDDDAIDLKWDSVTGSGSAEMDECVFTAGYRSPDGTLSGDGTDTDSLRILSDTGFSSTYTISCTDDHDTGGHSGVAYTDTDSVLIMLETECNDNVDNSDPEDVLADEDDPGCHTDGDPDDGDDTYDPLDDDETDGSPSMTLEACTDDNRCVSSGDTLTIDEFDEVTLFWTSENTDSCDSLGTFNMTGNPTSGDDPIVEPDAGETSNFAVGCTYSVNGGGILVRSVAVRHPAIQLIPYPNPPIIPSGGMPPSDPATVEPVIEGYLPQLCTLSGPDVDDTIANLTASGDLAGGTYEVDLNDQGETTYVLECETDANGDGTGGGAVVTDSATFRILPIIQET